MSCYSSNRKLIWLGTPQPFQRTGAGGNWSSFCYKPGNSSRSNSSTHSNSGDQDLVPHTEESSAVREAEKLSTLLSIARKWRSEVSHAYCFHEGENAFTEFMTQQPRVMGPAWQYQQGTFYHQQNKSSPTPSCKQAVRPTKPIREATTIQEKWKHALLSTCCWTESLHWFEILFGLCVWHEALSVRYLQVDTTSNRTKQWLWHKRPQPPNDITHAPASLDLEWHE